MCMPGTPEHDAWLKGEAAYNEFLAKQRAEETAAAEQAEQADQADDDDGDDD